jgi:hypothetical protein
MVLLQQSRSSVNKFLQSLKTIFRRMGAGLAASQQGEYLHGWLPAMNARPPESTVRPSPAAVVEREPALPSHRAHHREAA